MSFQCNIHNNLFFILTVIPKIISRYSSQYKVMIMYHGINRRSEQTKLNSIIK
jgi:hypothetical protein